MCDLAYVSLLREKVRQQDAEEKRVAASGTAPSARFMPWIMPASRHCWLCDGLEGRATSLSCWCPFRAKAASMNQRDTDDTKSVAARHSRNTEGM